MVGVIVISVNIILVGEIIYGEIYMLWIGLDFRKLSGFWFCMNWCLFLNLLFYFRFILE